MSPFFLRDLPISKHADLKRKKIFFLGPPHREKIILSRRQPQCLQLKIGTKNVQNQTKNGPTFSEKTD